MSAHDDRPETPLPGLYDHLLSRALEDRLRGLPDPDLAKFAEVDPEDAHGAIAQYLERLLFSSLSTVRGRDASERRRAIVDRLIADLAAELGEHVSSGMSITDPLRRLIAVHAHAGEELPRPDTPLARSALLTGTRRDPSLASQLNKEIASAARVDVLCSFIKWSGIRLLIDSLRALTATAHSDGPRLRVISTSYMGATDPRAMELLRELPNTEVRVSYDTARTRLHAKAYVIHRETGFGSAYIGSANISKAALSEGLEWTSKISQYELPHLWQKTVATFDSYWNDDEFELYDGDATERLREAIHREREPQTSIGELPTFDLRPYPFQEEILDALATEREVQGKHRHLVVAATGTGKTMVAAFDYRRWAGSERPSLLYIAHREEILKQALGTFRAVLRDQNFGDLLVGGTRPEQVEHLFCSIQSYQSRREELDAKRFRYVVVDEFHRAAAPSYQHLLNTIRPDILLGLTATPERSDRMDVLRWFDNETSAEIRLPDAINRRLLCPFQYFGVSDTVDLDGLRWQRGGYRVEDLDAVYTGNDVRAGLVLDKVRETLLEARSARGLGFCVSIAHANFMARFFNDHGIPSLGLSAESGSEERRSAKDRLRRREINFIFTVDLFNEGVDIPEIDTVLFLRPTESLTVYLQQLGRGLRLHDEKDCLTVLDFIGAHRREFHFASRLRALSTDPIGRLDREIEAGFPHLPSGCAIQFERVAQTRVLGNIRQAPRRIVEDLRELGAHYGRAPTIGEALDHLDVSLDQLLRTRGGVLWSELMRDAGLGEEVVAPDARVLAKGVRRLAHIDDPGQIRFALEYLDNAQSAYPLHETRLAMLFMSLWGKAGEKMSVNEAGRRLRENSTVVEDLRAVLRYRLRHTRTRPPPLRPELSGPLAVHAQYTRDEILAGLGYWTLSKRQRVSEGTLRLKRVSEGALRVGSDVDIFFVTLHKTEEDYSPTTMYEDYMISDRLFHWQSQSTTSEESPTGQRYIKHRSMGSTPLLFVREHRHAAPGLAAPYAYLGPAEYVSHEGSRPMSIVWRLEHAVPARLMRTQATASVL